MHKFPRPSLATLICPSAPFLAPSFRRTALPVSGSLQKCLHPPICAYATKSKQYKKGRGVPSQGATEDVPKLRITHHKSGPQDERHSEVPEMLSRFRQACSVRSLPAIMDLYPAVVAGGLLEKSDTRLITQALHYASRQKAKAAVIFPFVQRIIEDIGIGALPPQHQAFVHILSMYKEAKRYEEGLQLWQWLVQQDSTFVSQEAYGAAIELMAYGGIADLPALEKVYLEGLKRFPGTFAEYHLSPDAIVPDRSQPIMIPGIPVVLFQGILTARLLARDLKKSYMALDTLLRLYPTQTPPRVFDLFVRQRPIAEAYTTFMVACRTDVSMSPTVVTILLSRLAGAMEKSSSQSDRLLILKSMANALYAYMQVGIQQQDQLQAVHVHIFIRSFAALLPALPTPEIDEEASTTLRTSIAIAAHSTLSSMIKSGLNQELVPFEALLIVAGRLRVRNLFTATLADMDNAQLTISLTDLRGIMSSAGLFEENKDLVHQLWTRIVATYEKEGTQLTSVDWYTLGQVCHRIDDQEFLTTQLQELSHTTTAELHRNIAKMKPKSQASDLSEFQYISPAALEAGLEELKQITTNIEAVIMSGQPLNIQKSPYHMHVNSGISSLSSHEYIRQVYDELTTDPHQPPLPPQENAKLEKFSPRSAGIRLDELRFLNWVSVLEMLAMAEQSEKHFQRSIDEALASGKPHDRDSSSFVDPTSISLDVPETKDELKAWIENLRRA